jgi:hypothetical protein
MRERSEGAAPVAAGMTGVPPRRYPARAARRSAPSRIPMTAPARAAGPSSSRRALCRRAKTGTYKQDGQEQDDHVMTHARRYRRDLEHGAAAPCRVGIIRNHLVADHRSEPASQTSQSTVHIAALRPT